MNLEYYKNRWFVLYKGYIYGNESTDINTRINNKYSIDRQLKIQGKTRNKKIN